MASLRKLPLISATLLVPLLAHAASKTASINVSVTIVGECTVLTAQALNFGTNVSAGFSAPVDALSNLEVTCAANTPYSITLNGGLNAGGSIINRRLKAGAAVLDYGLYTDSNRSTPWGDGTAGAKVSGIGDGTKKTVPVYGQLKVPGSAPAPGNYLDTVTVTLTY
jgi:spore coat protein U-like protein